MILYYLVCGFLTLAGGMFALGVFLAAGERGAAGYAVAVVFLLVYLGLLYGLFVLGRRLRSTAKAASEQRAERKAEKKVKEPRAPRSPQEKRRLALRIVMVVVLVVFGLFWLLIAVACKSLMLGAFAAAWLVAAAWFAFAAEEKVFYRGPALVAFDKWNAERKKRAAAVPVKAVMVTAAMGQKNRMADGAAGAYLFGTVGALAGMMGSKPADKAIFYVTWDDGRTTTEKVTIGSEWFKRFMEVSQGKAE